MSAEPSRRVELTQDVVFGKGGDRDLRCDVYSPSRDGQQKLPAVLLVHGGAWKLGNRQQLKGYGFLIGRQGFVCVAGEYRLSEEAKWPAQLHDVKAALRWMRANADELGIDTQRIAVVGASSGGQMALVAAATANEADAEGSGGSEGHSTAVAAIVAFYAPTELERGGEMLKDFISLVMGPNASDDDYRKASPLSYPAGKFPPTLIFHSNRDDIVPRRQSLRLYEKLAEAGKPVELHVYDGEPHAFDARPELGREAASLIVSFLNRHMSAPKEQTS